MVRPSGVESTESADVARTLPGASPEFQRGNPAGVDGARPSPVAPPEASGHDSMQTGCKRPMPTAADVEPSDATAAPGSRAPVNPDAPGGHPCGLPDLPADLRAVAEAWPRLPEAVKAGIIAMVKAAANETGQPQPVQPKHAQSKLRKE